MDRILVINMLLQGGPRERVLLSRPIVSASYQFEFSPLATNVSPSLFLATMILSLALTPLSEGVFLLSFLGWLWQHSLTLKTNIDNSCGLGEKLPLLAWLCITTSKLSAGLSYDPNANNKLIAFP